MRLSGEPQHSLQVGQSLGPSQVMCPGDALLPQYTWSLNPLAQPSDAMQLIVAPSLAEQLTLPGTSIVPRQNPPGPEQPPGTQSDALLQSMPRAGSTHAPSQQDPRAWPGRQHNVPFGVFPLQTHWPPEHTSESPQPKEHAPQLVRSDWMFTHAPLHIWFGALQAQSIPEQVWFVGQACVT